MKYYIAENGQPAGPFEPQELMNHGLTVNSLVWCEGMPNWVSASQVPELAAVLSGTPFNPVNVDLPQMPQTPPMGDTQLPQVPPFGGQQQTQPMQPTPPSTQPTTYGPGPTTTQPYSPPQYGPSTNQVMPKTWLIESILATAASLLCCFNIVGIITGVLAIFKANSVKSKFMKGDITGSNNDSAAAKKWVLITVVVGVVWTLIQAYRIISDPSLLQQIQEGTMGSLYSF